MLDRRGHHFREHVFTLKELALAAERNHSAAFYAGRWAAKEAVAKALGCGIGAECAFTDIEIGNTGTGAPAVSCSGHAAGRMKKLGGKRWHLSISHEKNHAVAVAILEG